MRRINGEDLAQRDDIIIPPACTPFEAKLMGFRNKNEYLLVHHMLIEEWKKEKRYHLWQTHRRRLQVLKKGTVEFDLQADREANELLQQICKKRRLSNS